MADMEKRPYVLEEKAAASRMTPVVQRTTDRVVKAAFLWAFPDWVRPNHLTAFRFVLIPVILVLLGLGLRWWALGVFFVAICTDFIDGAIARTRGQITILGTYLDPVADKLLIGAVLAWIGHQYLVVQIILAFIVLELALTAVGARILLRTRTARASNAFGKSKMVVQSVALLLFLLGRVLDLQTWTNISLYLLWLALALAVASGVMQVEGVRRTRPPTESTAADPPGTWPT
jgi:CDP-diacylglycerol--glycerol-3-phosphate 3-phosphatidyltransferase